MLHQTFGEVTLNEFSGYSADYPSMFSGKIAYYGALCDSHLKGSHYLKSSSLVHHGSEVLIYWL